MLDSGSSAVCIANVVANGRFWHNGDIRRGKRTALAVAEQRLRPSLSPLVLPYAVAIIGPIDAQPRVGGA